jgi:hypothetical protein
MRMRQSLAQLEREFLNQAELDQQRQQQMRRSAAIRSRQRWHARERKRSSMRFYVLTLCLILTGVLVTVAMFATLYLLLS